jgi:hypothetical protein
MMLAVRHEASAQCSRKEPRAMAATMYFCWTLGKGVLQQLQIQQQDCTRTAWETNFGSKLCLYGVHLSMFTYLLVGSVPSIDSSSHQQPRGHTSPTKSMLAQLGLPAERHASFQLIPCRRACHEQCGTLRG